MATTIHTELDQKILTVSLSDEGGRPALDKQAYLDLAAIFTNASSDPGVRCVLLKGFSGCFCRGADLNEFTEPVLYPALISAVRAYFRSLVQLEKPLFACVDGEATGVGCTTLFHCDLVFASHRSTFRVPFVDFGLVPDAATSLLAPARLGYSEAFRFFCLGDVLDAQTAHRIGMISDLCEDGNVDAAALFAARRIARKPPGALEVARRLLRGDIERVNSRIDKEIDLFRLALDDEQTVRRLKRLATLAA